MGKRVRCRYERDGAGRFKSGKCPPSGTALRKRKARARAKDRAYYKKHGKPGKRKSRRRSSSQCCLFDIF